MATLQNDIPVATVDAARRGDEVLPEHEKQWPATDFVKNVIAIRYDGTASTSHEIGVALGTPATGVYPSWRVEQIAKQIGVHEPRRNELIERSRAQDEVEKVKRQHPGAKPMGAAEALKRLPAQADNPVRQMLREDLTAIAKEQAEAPTVCEQCNKAFKPWRTMRGVAYATKLCRDCFGAKMSKRMNQNPAAEQAKGVPVAPTLAAFVPVNPLPVVEIAPEDDDKPESFGDLPGSEIVFAFLDRLPITGHWSGRTRYRWLTAFIAALDMLIDDDRDDETVESEAWR